MGAALQRRRASCTKSTSLSRSHVHLTCGPGSRRSGDLLAARKMYQRAATFLPGNNNVLKRLVRLARARHLCHRGPTPSQAAVSADTAASPSSRPKSSADRRATRTARRTRQARSVRPTRQTRVGMSQPSRWTRTTAWPSTCLTSSRRRSQAPARVATWAGASRQGRPRRAARPLVLVRCMRDWDSGRACQWWAHTIAAGVHVWSVS
jgi:hypothetical protein